MKRTLRSLLPLSLSLLAAVLPLAAARAQTYDAVKDFNVLNVADRVWQYGYTAPDGSGFTAYDGPAAQAFDGLLGFRRDASDMGVTFNTTDRPFDYNICTTQQPDVLGLFPGNDGRKTVVRWKAPAAGTYRVAGRFQNIDHATADAVVAKNGDAANPLFAAFIESPSSCHQTTDTKPFSFTVIVNAGDTLDFRLGWGRNNQYSFDGTGLAAAITLGGAGGTGNTATVIVPGTANIYGAGHASVPGTPAGTGGTLPPVFRFPAAAGQVLTFPGVTGQIRFDVNNNDGGNGAHGPDGGPYLNFTAVFATGGISGIQAKNTGFLTGVFLTDAEPADPAPATLNFNVGALGADFANLSPAIGQVFLIGDGKTGTDSGDLQRFAVPANATRLFLGTADHDYSNGVTAAPPGSYDNNDGQFIANVAIAGGTPPPTTAPDLNVGLNAKTGGLGDNTGIIANVGDKIAYTLTVNNYGTGDATNVIVKDNLPRGLSFKSADNGGAITQGNTVTWNLGTLPPNKPGEGRVLRLNAKVTTDAVIGATIKNDSYFVQADGVPPIAGRDRDVATVVKPLVNVTADSDANSVRPGGQINYVLHVNVGDTGRSSDNVVVSFNVPDNTNLLSATYFVNGVPTPATGAGKTLSFNLGVVAAGSPGRDLNISVQVPYDVAPAASIFLAPQVSAARAGSGVITVGALPVLSAALSGQAPGNPPRLVLVKFVPDAVQTAEVLQLVPAARPALELAFPGVTTAAGLSDLQRTVNPDVLVGNGPDGFYEQEVIAPGRPGSPDQTFLTYALVYYNDADGSSSEDGTAPGSVIVDRVPDFTAYVPGSARMDLLGASEPTVTDNGKTLTFTVGKIKPQAKSTKPNKVPRIGLITYKVRVLAPAEGGRSALRTSIDSAPAFISTPVLANPVPSFPGALSTVLVAPGHGLLEAIQLPTEFKAGNVKEYDINYKNNGGLPALDFQFADSFPAGATFVSATAVKGRGGNVTDLNAATHSFTYHLGNVQPGESGTVRLRVQLTDAAVKQPGLTGVHSVALLQEKSFGPSTRRRPGNRGPVPRDFLGSLPPGVTPLDSPLFNVSRSEAPFAPHLGVGISAPMSVKAGDTFDYLISVMNPTGSAVIGPAVSVPIPAGTEFVSVTVDGREITQQGAEFTPLSTYNDSPQPAIGFSGQYLNAAAGQLVVVTVPAHGAILRKVTLRAKADTAGKVLRASVTTVNGYGDLSNASGPIPTAPIYSSEISTYVYRADQSFDSVRSTIVASALETQGFNAAALATTADFKVTVAALRPDAIHTSAGGIEGIQLSSGAFLAPLNVAGAASNNVLAIGPASAFSINTNGLVAAGAGNLVAAGAGNLIAAGAGNFIELPGLVAAGAGNLIAAGAGNFVNASGGNLTALEGLGNLIAAGAGNIFIRQPNGQLIAAGAGNLVAAGAGNLVAAGAGNLIAAGAGNLIAAGAGNLLPLEAAKLISQDGSGIVRGLTQNLVSDNGLGLISQDGSGLISQDGSGLISQDGSGIFSTKGGNSFAVGGGALKPNGGAPVLSNDGGSAVMLTGNALISAGAGNLVPNHGAK